jgi:hypothetical protein
LKLKFIDASKDVGEVVEIFNYNMGQIYRWWKNNYSINNTTTGDQTTEQDNVLVIHGMNIKGDKGDKGDKGNRIHFVGIGTVIIQDSVVTNPLYLESDLLISNSNVFEIQLIGGVLKHVLVGSIGGEKFILPITTDPIVSHSIIDWTALNNSTTSILSPYVKTDDKVEYYTINIGDYKKSSPLNGSLIVTNILEKKNDGSIELPTNATDPTSKDFSQIILQYRKGFDTDVSVQTITHKFYESASNGFVYNISNGQNQINSLTIGNIDRWMLGGTSSEGMIELKSSNIKLFSSQSMLLYHDTNGDNYYISKTSFTNPLPYLNLGFRLKISEINLFNTISNSYYSIADRLFQPYDVKEVDCTNAYIIANFDATGLGINERVGWAVCNGNNGTRNRNGRVGVAWGTLYATMGATFGSKDAVVVEHSHTIKGSVSTSGGSGQNVVNNVNNNTGDVTTSTVGTSGTDKNLQPSIVSLFIMKLP